MVISELLNIKADHSPPRVRVLLLLSLSRFLSLFFYSSTALHSCLDVLDYFNKLVCLISYRHDIIFSHIIEIEQPPSSRGRSGLRLTNRLLIRLSDCFVRSRVLQQDLRLGILHTNLRIGLKNVLGLECPWHLVFLLLLLLCGKSCPQRRL